MFCAGLCFLKKRRQISHIASSQLVALTEVAMRRQRFFFYSMVYQDVSNSPTAQRFFTLLLTLCAIGFLWINGIPLRPALQAHVLRLFSRNDVDESAFDRFFMEEKVRLGAYLFEQVTSRYSEKSTLAAPWRIKVRVTRTVFIGQLEWVTFNGCKENWSWRVAGHSCGLRQTYISGD